MNTLNFEKKARGSRGTQQYYDFIISGHSLRKILKAEDQDLVTPFGWCERQVEQEFIKAFLGEAPAQTSTGRIMIYVCPECLDIECGSITAELEFNENTVVWKKFGYENGYEDINFASFEHIHELKFEKQDYIAKFSKL
jgi:hypothetical protein